MDSCLCNLFHRLKAEILRYSTAQKVICNGTVEIDWTHIMTRFFNHMCKSGTNTSDHSAVVVWNWASPSDYSGLELGQP